LYLFAAPAGSDAADAFNFGIDAVPPQSTRLSAVAFEAQFGSVQPVPELSSAERPAVMRAGKSYIVSREISAQLFFLLFLCNLARPAQ